MPRRTGRRPTGEQIDEWFQSIADLAEANVDKCGFRAFRLKGGVMRPEEEARRAFPESHATLDPSGAWSSGQAIAACRGKSHILAYPEDPCSPENGYLGREIMDEF